MVQNVSFSVALKSCNRRNIWYRNFRAEAFVSNRNNVEQLNDIAVDLGCELSLFYVFCSYHCLVSNRTCIVTIVEIIAGMIYF